MNMFEIVEVKNKETNQVYCKMPKILFWLTEKGKPLSFLSGAIVVSYMNDKGLERGIFYHLFDAIIRKIS